MGKFEERFVQHIPNSYYGLHKSENKVNAIFTAKKLLLLADEYLHSNVNENDIKAIFVPHAGLKYSGICAASAYNAVLGNGNKIKNIKNIVIMSTRHSGKAGILVPNIDYFVYNHHKFKVNNSLYTEFNTINGVTMENDNEFLEEHSIEIQMPFVWNLFVGQNIRYLPILVGQLTNKQIYDVAKALSKLHTENTLWIISTDLMHANGGYNIQINKNISDTIIMRESKLLMDLVNPNKRTVLEITKKYNATKYSIPGLYVMLLWGAISQDMNFTSRITSYYCSLHISELDIMHKLFSNVYKFDINILLHRFDEQKNGCVSYLSMVYIPEKTLHKYPLSKRLSVYEKHAIYDFIKRITNFIASSPIKNIEQARKVPPPLISGSYLQNMGLFISFKHKEILRGCIGTTSIQNNLLTNIIKYTFEAGFNDCRKNLTKENPITPDEIKDGLIITINLLDLPLLISKSNIDNEERIKKWKIGKDGIMMIDKQTNKSAMFLPNVPLKMKWDKENTMIHLSNKAGLTSESWKNKSVQLFVLPGYEFGSSIHFNFL
jgi:AmmeMemoRadiSam system protein B/uncharacterized protein (TIGR00296 family)